MVLTTAVSTRRDRVGPSGIHARVHGVPGAPPVVLVHGLGLSGAYLEPLMRQLADDFHLYAPDLPGIGDSDRPDRPLAVPELADALIGWVRAAGLGPVSLVGHSLGAQVAVHAAERHPSSVRRLVLAAPHGDPSASTPVRQAVRLLRDAPQEAPSLLPLAVRDYLRAGPRRMWRTLRMSADLDLAAHLPYVRQPALVVRGGEDPLVSACWAEEVARLLPDGRAVSIPGAPHGVIYTTAEAFADVVRPFLHG